MLPFLSYGESRCSDLIPSALYGVDDGVELHEVEVHVTVEDVRDGPPDIHIDTLVAVGQHVIIGWEVWVGRHLEGVLVSGVVRYDHLYLGKLLRIFREVSDLFRVVSDAAVVIEDVFEHASALEVLHGPVGVLEHLGVGFVECECIFLHLVPGDGHIQDRQAVVLLDE